MLCLGIGVANTGDILIYIFRLSLCHTFCRRISAEKGWCDHIDTTVCTLCTQYDSAQQLEDRTELKLSGYLRLLCAEVLKNEVYALFLCHYFFFSSFFIAAGLYALFSPAIISAVMSYALSA